MSTKRPIPGVEPRHRKPGPARVNAGTGAGRRVREIAEADEVEAPTLTTTQEDGPACQQIPNAR